MSSRKRSRRNSYSRLSDQTWRGDLDSDLYTHASTSHHDHYNGLARPRRYHSDGWNYETSDPYVSNPFSTSMPNFSPDSYHGYDHEYDPSRYFSAYQRPYDIRDRGESSSSFVLPQHRMFHSTARYRNSLPADNSLSSNTAMHTFTFSAPLPGKHTSEPIDAPLASYLQLSLTPSLPLSPLPPSSLRKLLVLDLNGTLLVRSPRNHWQGNSSSRRSPEDDTAIQHPTEVEKETNRFSRVRHVYPRPFMPAFCAYLFSPSTLDWLDTMVWSSAQPHNVDDMVDKCFGNERKKLVAVWARDTLGLRRDDYHRKTQTTKDLVKPWTALSLRPSSPRHEPDCEAVEQPQIHSALTTILLDDSPMKARLQPWNHICIPEYSRKTRLQDLNFMQNEKFKDWKEVSERDEEEPTTSVGKKRKREQNRETTNTDSLLPANPSGEACKYDETLLAVIGILEAIKDESNVAGWIRAGSLWGADNHRRISDEGTTVKDGEDRNSDQLSKSARELEAGNDVEQLHTSRVDLPATTIEDTSPMWFENRETTEYWVNRGKDALSALGIELDAGIKS